MNIKNKIILLLFLTPLYACHEFKKDPELIKDSEKLVEEIIDDTMTDNSASHHP